ncbi:hypothetical protein G7Z17_g12700 [Cylindrodendrum hubeiense]|uniref:Uncharacterized protein n=1 Tax=Cylindrodendrum hubeiense TaxID=595255 RepID=A0A9P5H1F2_9HYPO|nr:hypothetical protein G7Z17_g12700 [Cylindrodendrum hubeiense]
MASHKSRRKIGMLGISKQKAAALAEPDAHVQAHQTQTHRHTEAAIGGGSVRFGAGTWPWFDFSPDSLLTTRAPWNARFFL